MYDRLLYPPQDYHICPCCGTEFGNDDVKFTHEQLREMWIAGGPNWFFGRPPERWNPWMQLIEGGHSEAVPPIRIRSVSPFFVGGSASTLVIFYEDDEDQPY